MQWIDYLIGVIGSILGVIGITLFLLSQKEIKNLISQLDQINHLETNQKITVGTGSKVYRALAIRLNEIIDEKKNAQRAFIKMEGELRETIANLSHDLRTPLTSMIGYMQLLEKENLEQEKRKQYLQIISGKAKNLQGLVENFYELSQINSNEYTLNCQEIHIERVFCELMASFYQDFVDKGLELKIEIEDYLPSIYADETALTRIILNLIQNTLRYAKKNIHIRITKEENRVRLTVMNEVGELKESDIPYLFDRFFMANRVRNGEGTGVGLAVVKKLVNIMGGEAVAEIIGDQIAISVVFKSFNKL